MNRDPYAKSRPAAERKGYKRHQRIVIFLFIQKNKRLGLVLNGRHLGYIVTALHYFVTRVEKGQCEDS